MEMFLSVLVGLGLAAACGFRVFVPLLVLGVAARAGAVDLGSGMGWVGSTEAIVAFAVASALEIAGYWVPWVDHALDVAASPAAVIAGTLVAASQFGGDTGPFLRWSAAIVAGGGLAGTVQATTVATRVASTASTAGVANPVISTVQSVLAALLSVVAVVAPVVAAVLVLLVLAVVARVLLKLRKLRKRRIPARA